MVSLLSITGSNMNQSIRSIMISTETVPETNDHQKARMIRDFTAMRPPLEDLGDRRITVIHILIQEGEILQKELFDRLYDVPPSSLWRILKDLEMRHIIYRIREGRTYRVGLLSMRPHFNQNPN